MIRFYGDDAEHNVHDKEIQSDNSMELVSWVYFHGELQTLVGYDLVYKKKDALVPYGTYKCKVGNYDAVAYIWEVPSYKQQTGLIVLESNEEDNKYAMSRYLTQSKFL